MGTIRRNMGRPGRDKEPNYGFKMLFMLMKELQRREMDIFSVLFYMNP